MKKRFLWIIAGVVFLIAVFSAYYMSAQGTAVQVTAVSKGEIRQYIEDTAVVKCSETRTVYIEGAGKVSGMNVNTGDAVKQGDLLLSLDKADLELQLKDAQAKIDAIKAQLKGTDIANYANRIEIAEAAVEQAKIAYDSALKNYNNARKLYESNSLSKGELDNVQAAFKTAENGLNSAKLQLEEIQKGTPEYVKEGYKAQLEQAVVYRDTILRNLQKQEARAPMDGIVLEKLVDDGSVAVTGTPAFIIGNTGKLELEANILTDDISKVKTGNDVEISGKTLGGIVLKGKVEKIAPAAKVVVSSLGVNQRRVEVTIRLQEGNNAIKPGYNADVKIITAVKKDALKVPGSSVFDDGEGSSVFVVENGKAVLKRINKGYEDKDWIEAVDGLKEGDTVLTKPDNNVKAGMKVKTDAGSR
jgi:HlyD family secretion protein